ncbi:DUF922 domain-containing protein [Pontibacter diazotrophicus]|uniref:DUF922 domain-containing protein n=1 Tax=Pontibacter diazotrophicus TaxID=1400979 RepID=A0A3D8L6N9_9BACT|nr:DUF922 domain-containing protein [Pontibacter diazotrophicus]RDV12632.1 DUF922 domain-containing protein [Pontibacter diazotrophicus]
MYTFTLFLSLWARILLPLLFPDAATAKEREITAPVVENIVVDQVTWSMNRRLSWEDFRGQPDEKNPHHALTAANLAVNANCKNQGFTYQVNCVFLPTESWTKNKKSQQLLEHEQLHFDLTEVHARLLRKELQNLNCANLKEKLNATVSRAFAKWKADQEAFDTASKHGVNAEKERQWAATIAQRLRALESYK